MAMADVSSGRERLCGDYGFKCAGGAAPIARFQEDSRLRSRSSGSMATDVRDRRDRMVDVHLAGRGIRDQRVLEAMRRVPREAFVDAGFEEFAYEDNPLPIGEQQTISQPYIVALMLEAAEIGEDDSVLEIGAGPGYAAAVAAQLAKRVCAIERHASL